LLYTAYQANVALSAPARLGSTTALKLLEARPEALRGPLARHVVAASTLVAGNRLTHARPDFERGVPFVDAGGNRAEQDVVAELPFANLVRFRVPNRTDQPKVLIAAPLSGHFATMLAPTVRTMLTDHEVYITDWRNARDVPVSEGRFGLDEYVDHLVQFLRLVGPGAHVLAVCQPCVPAVMAVAALAADDDPAQPQSLTLMAGPIDTRANPARINRIAYRQPLAAYRRLLTVVPRWFPGAGRLVYPGFLQIGGFMSLNLRRHVGSYREIYRSIARGEADSSKRTRDFYAEYYAVMDMDGDFYLDSIQRIFQQDLLARGLMTHHGRGVDPGVIHRTALLTVEAERDDMCLVGQTAAAHRLFSGIKPNMHREYVQPGVGHYGVFAGSRWATETYPVVRDFITDHSRLPTAT
jgi:poly(3-hydroxybutyrate) depolymerase